MTTKYEKEIIDEFGALHLMGSRSSADVYRIVGKKNQPWSGEYILQNINDGVCYTSTPRAMLNKDIYLPAESVFTTSKEFVELDDQNLYRKFGDNKPEKCGGAGVRFGHYVEKIEKKWIEAKK